MTSAGPAAPHRALRATVGLALAVLLLPACATIPFSGPVVAGPDLQRDPGYETVQQLAYPPGENADPDTIVRGFLRAGVDYRRRHEVARSYLATTRRSRWEPGASVLVTPQDPVLKIIQVSSSGVVPPSTTSTSSVSQQPEPSALATPVEPAPTATPTEPSGAPAPSAPVIANPAPRVVLRLDLPLIATIDGQGRYRESPAGTTRTLTFTVERRGGQWRITDLPDGIVVGKEDFGTTFHPYPVYFPDTTGQHLLPDLRWFPVVGDTLRAVPTALVSAMLDGPSPWLAPVVASGAPEGTKLASPAVLISDGVATVDLSAEARQTVVSQRQRLLGQLRATLRGLYSVSDVAVQVEGTELDLGTSDGGQSSRLQLPLELDPQPDSSHLVFVSGEHRLTEPAPDKNLPIAGLGIPAGVPGVDALNRADVSHPAVDRNATTYAALFADRTQLLGQPPGAKAPRRLISVTVPGAHLSPPSFDPEGWVWSTSDQPSEAVTAANFAGGVAQVAARWLAPYSVTDLRVSRDGARVAIVARRNNQSLIFVAPIVRRADGRPSELGEPIRVNPRVSGVTDLAWADHNEIVMIGASGPGDGGAVGATGPAIWLSQIGGITKGLGQVGGADSITAADNEEQIYVGTDDGQIFYHPGQWVPWTKGRWPAMPG